MKNIHNAVADTVEYYDGLLTANVTEDLDNRWKIEVRNIQRPNVFLEIEILLIDNEPIGCVLQKVNVSRRSMGMFMDVLMDFLEND